MKLLSLHDTKMPALGFGTWQLRDEVCKRAVSKAIDIGYRHIDTAQIYENEEEVGQGIAASGIGRSEIFLTTKLWLDNLTAARVAASMAESLERLRMEYVDLLLIHWPNPAVPLGETLGAMRELQRRGLTRAIGVSNFPVRLMHEAVEVHGAPLASNQVECHVMLQQRAVRDYAVAHGMVVTAYCPLARGKVASNEVLAGIGRKYGKTASQVALRWLVQLEQVAAIPKAASEKNARANFDIFDFELSAADMAAIGALDRNMRLINPDFAPGWDRPEV